MATYDVHDKELLAVIQAFQGWKQYTMGSQHRIRVFNGPQEPGHLHDDKGPKWKTRQMGIDP